MAGIGITTGLISFIILENEKVMRVNDTCRWSVILRCINFSLNSPVGICGIYGIHLHHLPSFLGSVEMRISIEIVLPTSIDLRIPRYRLLPTCDISCRSSASLGF